MAHSWKHPQVNGGMGNVCDASPVNSKEFQLGGDLWGWYRTVDNSHTFFGQMFGQSGIGSIYARGCRFSLADPSAVYIAVGTLKSAGGFMAICKGYRESRLKGPQFGANLGAGAGGTLPRPVGNLIDVIMAGGVEHIYAAAYNGIMHSTDKGQTFKTLVGGTGNWKAIAALDTNTALAARYQLASLTLVRNGSVSKPASPGVIHDLRMIAGTCWAVGPTGVFQWDGSKLVKHAAASSYMAGTTPTTIAGSADGQVIIIGTNTPGSSKVVSMSTDGGKTWKPLGGNAVMTTFDGRDYWLKSAATNGWGQKRFSASQVAIDQKDPTNFLVAGRGGAWASNDGGKTIHPCAPNGDEITALRGGPGGDEFAGNDGDWVGWHTSDLFQHQTAKQNQVGVKGGLTISKNGHNYVVKPGAITMDGKDIADDVFRGGSPNPKAVAVTPSGKVLVAQLGGSLLLGTP